MLPAENQIMIIMLQCG